MGKSLFAAGCGVVLGAAVLIVCGMLGWHELWPALLVGVLSGVIMRVMSKHSAAGSYSHGALAAVSVLLAVLVGKFTLVSVLSKSAEEAVLPVLAQVEESEEAPAEGDQGEATEESEDQAAVDDQARAPVDIDAGGTITVPKAMDVDVYDAVFMIVGALIAYQIGKGEGSAPVDEEASEPETPAEPQPEVAAPQS